MCAVRGIQYLRLRCLLKMIEQFPHDIVHLQSVSRWCRRKQAISVFVGLNYSIQAKEIHGDGKVITKLSVCERQELKLERDNASLGQ